MTEYHLALSLAAVRAMAEGDELVFDIADDDVRVFLRCDDEAVASFRSQIEKALLHMLPTSDSVH